jgi:hypothetical protein
MKYIGLAGWDVITRYSIDWRPLDPTNFSAGVIYFAEGEPYQTTDGVYRTLDLEWWISCGTNDLPSAPAEYMIDDNGTTGLFIGVISSTAGCPTFDTRPIATPPYSPKCQFTRRSDANRSVGLQFDLAELNGGPFGVKSKWILNDRGKTVSLPAVRKHALPSCQSRRAFLCVGLR